MTYIKKGCGFNVGNDFARATEDTPIEVTGVQGCWIYGYIEGNPQSSLGFMRTPRVNVRVRNDCLSKLHTDRVPFDRSKPMTIAQTYSKEYLAWLGSDRSMPAPYPWKT